MNEWIWMPARYPVLTMSLARHRSSAPAVPYSTTGDVLLWRKRGPVLTGVRVSGLVAKAPEGGAFDWE